VNGFSLPGLDVFLGDLIEVLDRIATALEKMAEEPTDE
jgi:hypothetical protein